MRIVDFGSEHIGAAQELVRAQYARARARIAALPPVEAFPELRPFAENGLGAAALQGDALIGFLCTVAPFPNAFRSTDAVGVYCPLHASAAIEENRGELYARLYQAAAEKWTAAGASSHAICLYAHDEAAQRQLFHYGFGLRCVDAIRDMASLRAPECPGFTMSECTSPASLYTLELGLHAHLAASPTFLAHRPPSEAEFLKNDARFFIAKKEGEAIAFLQFSPNAGETFLCQSPGMQNLCGAYCLPEYQGKGIMPKLLDTALDALRAEGIQRVGVDFESLNPNADRFWRKHFQAYTHSLVRRIDEHALGARE